MNDLNLTKRARAKYFTLAFLYPLMDLCSDNQKKYIAAWYCSRILMAKHFTTHTKIYGKYCKQRFCTVCNRIRTAQYIQGYSKIIDSFKSPYFLTITNANCNGRNLHGRIETSQRFFRIFNRSNTRQGIKLKYLRKLEVTFNSEMVTYHPHYHIVCENKATAQAIRRAWLEFWGEQANTNGQNIKKCDLKAKIELFKYFTNIIKRKGTSYEFEPIAFDLIISALDKVRIFQPVGIKKFVEAKQPELFTEELSTLLHDTEYFYNDKLGNWMNFDSETMLTSYKPSKKFIKMCKSIGLDDRDMRERLHTKDIFVKNDSNTLNLDLQPDRNF